MGHDNTKTWQFGDKEWRKHYFWDSGEYGADGSNLGVVTLMVVSSEYKNGGNYMEQELPVYAKAITEIPKGTSIWLPNDDFGYTGESYDDTYIGDFFRDSTARKNKLTATKGADNEYNVTPHLKYQKALKGKLDMAIAKWEQAGEPNTWDKTTEQEDMYIDAVEIIRNNYFAEQLKLPLFVIYHTRDTEFLTDGINPWAQGGWMDFIHKPTIKGSPWDGDWVKNKYKPFWDAVRGTRQAQALGIISKDKFIDEVLFKIDAFLPDIKFAKPGENLMWHQENPFVWPRSSKPNDKNSYKTIKTNSVDINDPKNHNNAFPPGNSFDGHFAMATVASAIAADKHPGFVSGIDTSPMGAPWSTSAKQMTDIVTYNPLTRYKKGTMPFSKPARLFKAFGEMEFYDSVLDDGAAMTYDKITKDNSASAAKKIDSYMPLHIKHDFVPFWKEQIKAGDKGPYFFTDPAMLLPPETDLNKNHYYDYTGEDLDNALGKDSISNSVATQIYHYQKSNANTWKSRFIDPPVPPDLSSRWINFNNRTTWANLITAAYDDGLRSYFLLYDRYLTELSADSQGPAVLSEDTKKMKFSTVENDDDFNIKENANIVTNYFIETTAYYACALLVGHYKAEAQKQFLLEVLKLNLLKDKDQDVTDFDDIESDAVDGLKDSGIQSKKPTPGAGRSLSSEEIEKRQKFFKQCALMLNLEQFVEANRNYIGKQNGGKFSNSNYHANLPYDSRFWMMEDQEDQASALNKLYCPQDLSSFLNMPQAIVNMLVPKLRIYQVYDTQDGLEQVEFQFEQQGLGLSSRQIYGQEFGGSTQGVYEKRLAAYRDGGATSALAQAQAKEAARTLQNHLQPATPAERMANIMSSEFDRGNGAGIKNCEIIYEGTSPATARNDIQVKLSLYFQSFNDFFKVRKTRIGQQYKFVDMVLYPKNDEKSISRQKAGQYDPANYRLRLDTGWQLPPEELRGKINRIAEKHFSRAYSLYSPTDYYDDLCKVISIINKSYYLNMVDHNIDIKDTGACEIKIDYRAYIESAMKTNRFNALLDPQTYEVKKRQDVALDDARKKECSKKDFIALRREIDRQNDKIVQQSHQSIIRRLLKRKKIFYLDVFHRSKEEFERNGFFVSRPRYKNFDKDAAKDSSGVDNSSSGDQKSAKEAAESGNTGGNTFVLLKEDFVDEDIGKNVRVNYFFMGDLIYTILDVIFEIDGTRQDMQNTRLLLGSFEFIDYDGVTRVANIADIPVSADYFFEWYTKHVVGKRTTFPVMYFIRTLCNHLITDLLGDKCRNKSLILKTRFNTGSFLAAPGAGNTDPFLTLYKKQRSDQFGEYAIIDVANHYLNGDLPLPHIDRYSDTGIKNFYNFMLVYPLVSPMVNHKGVGNEVEDSKRGVAHIHLGGQVGVVKKVNFEKTDIQYIRESRFLNQGDDGYLQLGAVYKATVDMVGNTIWYPGMEIFINPIGIGGMEIGLPSQGGSNRSKANALGLGGYHIITRVTSNLVPGKFSTKLEAQFHYSGDGLSDRQRLGFFKEDEKKEIEQTARISEKCKTILKRLEQTTQEIGSGGIEESGNVYTFQQSKNAKEEGFNKTVDQMNAFYDQERVDAERRRREASSERIRAAGGWETFPGSGVEADDSVAHRISQMSLIDAGDGGDPGSLFTSQDASIGHMIVGAGEWIYNQF